METLLLLSCIAIVSMGLLSGWVLGPADQPRQPRPRPEAAPTGGTGSRLAAYELLLSGSFGLEMNANDFFVESSAMSVTIDERDVPWVAAHVERWGQDGVDSAIAYIQNLEPLDVHRTPGFEAAMADLAARSPRVSGDVDHAAHGYLPDGPYRDIDPRWLPAAPPAEPGCPYDVCHKGRCGRDVPEGQAYCADHQGAQCRDCGAQAAGDCYGYSGSFVCGYPKCPDHPHRH